MINKPLSTEEQDVLFEFLEWLCYVEDACFMDMREGSPTAGELHKLQPYKIDETIDAYEAYLVAYAAKCAAEEAEVYAEDESIKTQK